MDWCPTGTIAGDGHCKAAPESPGDKFLQQLSRSTLEDQIEIELNNLKVRNAGHVWLEGATIMGFIFSSCSSFVKLASLWVLGLACIPPYYLYLFGFVFIVLVAHFIVLMSRKVRNKYIRAITGNTSTDPWQDYIDKGKWTRGKKANPKERAPPKVLTPIPRIQVLPRTLQPHTEDSL